VLFQILVLVPLALIGITLGGIDEGGTGSLLFVGLIGIFVLAFLIPGIAVQVRRFHDQDKSGWFVLLGFIPYIGGIILFVFMCIEGTRGPNRFGPDPKDPYGEAVFE
jgi:uncharacterized membrane protein YhaH (DUF805 family)